MKIKSLIITLLIALMLGVPARADRVKNQPVIKTQPNGEIINCFVSGDEFFNYLHDKEGYTIIQHDNGYFYYATKTNDKILASKYLVNSVDPASTELTKFVKISAEEYYKKRNARQRTMKGLKDAPTSGTVNTIAVYIRFQGESEFTSNRNFYDGVFSDENGPSLTHYYNEVSYNTLFVNTYHYPDCADTTTISYMDIHPRSYYQKYNATANPNGYKEDESTEREHNLLKRAVEFVDSQIPDSINFDANDNGEIDNVSFIIKGRSDDWADLLWPHRWSLYSENATINGKLVRDYLLMLETGFGLGTLCHEFFHVLGAPDLYHYEDTGAPRSVGGWDIMDSSADPPQYMGAYMKYKYGDWIPEPPTITESGTYKINPLINPDNNIYRINSPYSANEFFILEFRKQVGMYEVNAPGGLNGLLVYRIDDNAGNGNADGPPDEVFLYRPDGTISEDGNLDSAPFNGAPGKRTINDLTNPNSFLYNNGDGGPGGLNISNIHIQGDTVVFNVGISQLLPPLNLRSEAGDGFVSLEWTPLFTPDFHHYNIYRDGSYWTNRFTNSYTDRSVTNGTTYSYTIKAFYAGNLDENSGPSNTVYATPLGKLGLPYSQDFETHGHAWKIKGTVDGFQWGDGTSLAMGSGNGSKFFGARSVNGIRVTDYAISPVFDLSSYSNVSISFDYLLYRWMMVDELKLVYRRSKYDDWVIIADLPKTGGWNSWRSHNIDLPSEALRNGMQLAFLYDDDNDYGYGAGFDNVSIYENSSGITETKLNSGVSIFPNPSTGTIYIDLNSDKNEKIIIEIYSISGKKIYTRKISKEPGNLKFPVNLNKEKTGIYIISVNSETKTYSEKIIIE